MEAAVIMNPEVSIPPASDHPALLLGTGASEPSKSAVIGPYDPITLYLCHFSPVSAWWITQTLMRIMINHHYIHHHIDDDETCWRQLLLGWPHLFITPYVERNVLGFFLVYLIAKVIQGKKFPSYRNNHT